MVAGEQRDGQVWLRVEGVMDCSNAERLQAALLRELGYSLRAKDVVIDLRGCSDYQIEGRAKLAEVHQLLLKKARRTVYIADRPRVRGMVLLSMSLHDDYQCRAVPNERLAMQWLHEAHDWVERAYTRAKNYVDQGHAKRRRL
jgi:hypothetical protein